MTMQMKKYYLPLLLSLGLFTACSQQQQEPKAGEYGEVKVASIQLTSAEIAGINSSEMPKPNPMKRPTMWISSQLDPTKNPYRFVTVVKGTAIQDGEVKMRLFGGIHSEDSSGFFPTIFDHPTVKAKANENIVLVISSDPFSANAKDPQQRLYYQANAELSERNNITVSAVELQIWQGQGSQRSWVSYLKFLVLFLIIFGLAYRAYDVLVRAR